MTVFQPRGFGGTYLDDIIMPEEPTYDINRNAPCWCRSGLKYKACHRGRADEKPPTLHEIGEIGRQNFMTGRCLHPHASNVTCRGKGAIRSHSIQRGGGLAAIAEAGHLLTNKPTLQEINERQGAAGLNRIGLNQASTFPGFCSFHDASLFRPIERASIQIDSHAAFLFGYRAISLEVQRKQASLAYHTQIATRMDAGRSIHEQYAMQCQMAAMRYGTQVGARDLQKAKPSWDQVLLKENFSSVHFAAVWLDGLLPIAATTAHLPATDFHGTEIQDLWRRDVEGVTFTITSFEGRSLAIVVWLGSQNGAAAKFSESLLALPDNELASAIINAAFAITENLFVQISWWENLPKNLQSYLLERTLDGVDPEQELHPRLHGYPTDISALRPIDRLQSDRSR